MVYPARWAGLSAPLALVPGTAFGASGQGLVRCGYGTGLDQIAVAMERMTDSCKRAKARQRQAA